MAASKKMGRPLTKPHLGRRYNMGFRLSAVFHDRVAALAAETGHSISETVENIIERHFERADLRTIIREEIVADRERQESARQFMADLLPQPPFNMNEMTYLNGEPRDAA